MPDNLAFVVNRQKLGLWSQAEILACYMTLGQLLKLSVCSVFSLAKIGKIIIVPKSWYSEGSVRWCMPGYLNNT